MPDQELRAALELLDVIDGIVDDTHPEGDGCPLCAALDDLRLTLQAEAPAPAGHAAWAEAEATRPDGWIFHGVELADHSMEGGGWGPDWMAAMTWPAHCDDDACDHDEAFRVGRGATPEAALRALVALAAQPPEEPR